MENLFKKSQFLSTSFRLELSTSTFSVQNFRFGALLKELGGKLVTKARLHVRPV